MDMGMIVARLIHVLAGIFWVGAMLFVTWYLTFRHLALLAHIGRV